MFEFIGYVDCHDKQSTLSSLDMCKAFDSLKWEFTFMVFEYYGFGNNFLRFFKNRLQYPKMLYD